MGCVPSAAVAVSGGLPKGGVCLGGVCLGVDRISDICPPCCNYVADGNKLSYNICKMVMILGHTFRCGSFTQKEALLHKKNGTDTLFQKE